jgi:uncharacterized membrane protein YhaH (DUF805 family)
MNLPRYWSLSGRFTRLQWWRFQIWAMFGFIVVVFAAINIEADRLRIGLIAAAAAVFLLALIAVTVKRLHDRNRSGWWIVAIYGIPFLLDSAAYAVGANYYFYFAIPATLINLWVLVELGFLRGSRGPNRYGDDPIGTSDLPPALPAVTHGAD